MEACPFFYQKGIFAPSLFPDSSLVIRSSAHDPLFKISCFSNRSLTSLASTIDRLGSCECPDIVDDTQIKWARSPPNTLIQRSCPEPLLGTVTRWCSSSCDWIVLDQKCRYESCPGEIGFGVFWPRSLPNRIVSVPCVSDSHAIAMTRRCGLNGEWKSVELGSCFCSQEGEWPSTGSNNYIHLSCPQGFQGSITRRCNRFGEWGPIIWDCKSLVCPKERIGSLEFPETPAGVGVALPCPVPFFGTLSRQCDSHGTWDEVIDHCIISDCDAFGFSLDASNTLAVHYNKDKVTQLSLSLGVTESLGVVGTMEAMSILQTVGPVDTVGSIGSIGKEKPNIGSSIWMKGKRIESNVLQTWIPHTVNIIAWNHWVAMDACYLRNLVVMDRCTEMDAPFLDHVDNSGHVSVGIVFPFCGTLIPTEWSLIVKSVQCDHMFSWQEDIACEDTSHCKNQEIGRILIPQILNPQCIYKAYFSLSFDSSTLDSQSSPPLIFQPFQHCEKPILMSHVSLVSSRFVMVHWNTTTKVVFNTIRIGMATSTGMTYKPPTSLQVPFQAICTSTVSCDHVNFITLPVPQTGAWLDVQIQATLEGMCGGQVESSSLLFVPQVPSVAVEIESEDSFLRIRVVRHVGFAWIRIAIANILGEEFQNTEFPLLQRNSSEMLIGGLHPNSRYLVSWEIMDYSAVSISNHTLVRTKPFRSPHLVSHVLQEGRESVLIRFWSSVDGQVRCKVHSTPDETLKETSSDDSGEILTDILTKSSNDDALGSFVSQPSILEYSTRSFDEWNIQIGILHSAEERIVPVTVPPSSSGLQCILLDEAGEVRISSHPHVIHYFLHSTNQPDIATLVSISPSLPVVPYGTKITVQFTRPIVIRNFTNLLYFDIGHGLSLYVFPEDSVYQESISSFSFVLRGSHVDIPLSVCLQSQSMVVDAATGSPVNWGSRQSLLPAIFDTVIAGGKNMWGIEHRCLCRRFEAFLDTCYLS